MTFLSLILEVWNEFPKFSKYFYARRVQFELLSETGLNEFFPFGGFSVDSTTTSLISKDLFAYIGIESTEFPVAGPSLRYFLSVQSSVSENFYCPIAYKFDLRTFTQESAIPDKA